MAIDFNLYVIYFTPGTLRMILASPCITLKSLLPSRHIALPVFCSKITQYEDIFECEEKYKRITNPLNKIYSQDYLLE